MHREEICKPHLMRQSRAPFLKTLMIWKMRRRGGVGKGECTLGWAVRGSTRYAIYQLLDCGSLEAERVILQ